MPRSLWDVVQKTRDAYRAYYNDDEVLCNCKKCAATANDKPIYDRVPLFLKRTCSDHMRKERVDPRKRGRPSAVSLPTAPVLGDAPAESFYSVKEIVDAHVKDLLAAAEPASAAALQAEIQTQQASELEGSYAGANHHDDHDTGCSGTALLHTAQKYWDRNCMISSMLCHRCLGISTICAHRQASWPH